MHGFSVAYWWGAGILALAALIAYVAVDADGTARGRIIRRRIVRRGNTQDPELQHRE
ncbi:hypothetical protein [Actinacidiphila glaucinigra]|uniref:Uncharacterized protein n=1 Tax=Actinacidiphila glaucinigra TaxID=235986 RepID=A0A239DQF5_9ACTN|nr:hypothetical protein [Actinacidiphila glaucinigra]SNS34409.1 hypothetical protein SAMN05216252_10599 [Actinacidiphila glaucinigra]